MADENELLDEQVKLLRFSSERASFEMAVTIEEDETLQSGGDAYVTVQVQSQGFVGHNDLWVVGAALASFAADLRALERSLQGEARLKSISPNELDLRVFAVDRRGHLAIEGSTGYWTHDGGEQQFWHAVTFGFAFEPQQLMQAMALPWLRR